MTDVHHGTAYFYICTDSVVVNDCSTAIITGHAIPNLTFKIAPDVAIAA
jgi:hypothetical protein